MENKEKTIEALKKIISDIESGRIDGLVLSYKTKEGNSGNLISADVLTAFGITANLFTNIQDSVRNHETLDILRDLIKN